MTKILLIRHGDTEYVDEALAGRINSPLNAEGIEQSHRIAEALKHLSDRCHLCQPLDAHPTNSATISKLPESRSKNKS